MGSLRDSGSERRTVQTIKPQNQDGDGTVTGAAVDRLGAAGGPHEDCVALFNTGAATGSPSGIAVTCKLQHSDASGSGFADISGASVTIDDENQHKELFVDLRACKRYLKAVMVVAFTGGTSPTIDLNADIDLGNPKTMPA